MMKYTVEILENNERRLIQINAERIGNKLWYHFDGETYFFEETTSSRKKSGPSNKNGLLAPMPGKITKILKSKGDSVVENEVLIVMEAMKMEYSLKSPSTGIIEEIYVQAGSIVPLGTPLAKVKV